MGLQKSNIFICYRRSDSADVTGRIYDRLVNVFGEECVFKDVDSILLGRDYRDVLQKSLSNCNIFLAIIGNRWLHSESGERFFDQTDDFVRFEIETALTRNIPIIPLLVQGTSIPSEGDLPESLREFRYRNGMVIRTDPDFNNDIARLIRNIQGNLG